MAKGITKKNLPDPSQERSGRFSIYNYNYYVVGPLPPGTCNLPELNSKKNDLRIQAG
jgi:hypothetical protein